VSTEEPMSIEDRIRTATRAGASLVRDIGPMTATEPARLRRRPARTARRWGTWGIPLAAAAAVVLVALSLVAVRQFGASAPATGGPATNGSATTVPRYYVDLDASDVAYTGFGPLITGGDALIVGDDVTGKVIATIEPPPGLHFDSVQGASDDRTFVVLANPRGLSLAGSPAPGPETLYLLRIAPGTAHPYQLTKLPIKLQRFSAEVVAYALSPDDRELAVEWENFFGGQINRLAIYSVPSGAELRAWTTNKFSQVGGIQQTLSWLSGGRQLAFSAIPPGRGGNHAVQMRTINVTGPGTDLRSDSHVVLTVTSPISSPASCWTLGLTSDGGTVTCATTYGYGGLTGTAAGCANGGLEVTAYSARTGRPVRVLYKFRDACTDGLAAVPWTAPAARSIIGATETDLPGGTNTPHGGQIGVISDGHLRPLKLAKGVSWKDYLMIAF
jgi:hypothetical protein